jgi:hypothetical protein
MYRSVSGFNGHRLQINDLADPNERTRRGQHAAKFAVQDVEEHVLAVHCRSDTELSAAHQRSPVVPHEQSINVRDSFRERLHLLRFVARDRSQSVDDGEKLAPADERVRVLSGGPIEKVRQDSLLAHGEICAVPHNVDDHSVGHVRLHSSARAQCRRAPASSP